MEKSSWVFAIVVVGILVGITAFLIVNPLVFISAVVVGILVGVTAFLIVNPLVFISAGERGVVLRWGAVTDSVSIP